MRGNPNTEWTKKRKILLMAAKIAVGSSAAIYTAQMFGLEYVISAGTITLLTLMATKWETVRLSVFRLVTFAVTVVLAWIIFMHVESMWIGYGIFIFCMVLFAEMLDWRATISVNSVIGAHLLSKHDFGLAFVKNEFYLVIIGIVAALILNLFHNNQGHEKDLISRMRYTEARLREILIRLADYLSDEEMRKAADLAAIPKAVPPRDGSALAGGEKTEGILEAASSQGGRVLSGSVWDDVIRMEKELQGFILEAYEYQENTFHSHPAYYIDYFEMRSAQCHTLHNLHYEVKKIRFMPKQAKVVAEYMRYLVEYVVERNEPTVQMEKLESIFRDMKKEDLPKSREEFESRAILYHILMDIEEFLKYKQRFVKGLDERQRKMYWERQPDLPGKRYSSLGRKP